jgi:hypothetical protein
VTSWPEDDATRRNSSPWVTKVNASPDLSPSDDVLSSGLNFARLVSEEVAEIDEPPTSAVGLPSELLITVGHSLVFRDFV